MSLSNDIKIEEDIDEVMARVEADIPKWRSEKSDVRRMNNWASFFIKAGVSPSKAKTYAATFVKNEMGNDTLKYLDRESLREIGINALGDIFRILEHAQKVIMTEVKVVEVEYDDIKKEIPIEEDTDEVMAIGEAYIPEWRSEKSQVMRQESGHLAVDGPSQDDRNKAIRRRTPMKQEGKPEAGKAANSSK